VRAASYRRDENTASCALEYIATCRIQSHRGTLKRRNPNIQKVLALRIERLSVDGGFLDGLDLQFRDGLNVLIGGRGTGKTSVVELIRYCLDIRNYTDASAKRSKEHALAVLEDGQVRVTVTHGNNSYVFTRQAAGPPPQVTTLPVPIIFSQTDIEALGLQAEGRLRLIDSFRQRRGKDAGVSTENLVASVQSVTAEMQQLNREMEALDSQLSEINTLEARIREIETQEASVAAHSAEAQKKQLELQRIDGEASAFAISADVCARTNNILETFLARLESLIGVPPSLEAWPTQAGTNDLLKGTRVHLESAISHVRLAAEEIRLGMKEVTQTVGKIGKNRAPLDAQARQLRKDIDGYRQGAGALARQASQLRERLAQLRTIAGIRAEKATRLESLRARRAEQLDSLEENWERRFNDRVEAAEKLNQQLSPQIRIRPLRAAQITTYAGVLASALRGSALRYNELSVAVAKRVSPREIVELVESGDADRLAELVEISRDRAMKMITHIR
jgi:DNA repair ATPase RecN